MLRALTLAAYREIDLAMADVARQLQPRLVGAAACYIYLRHATCGCSLHAHGCSLDAYAVAALVESDQRVSCLVPQLASLASCGRLYPSDL